MVKEYKRIIIIIYFCIVLLASECCTNNREKVFAGEHSSVLRLASTSSTKSSGLFDVLLPVFEHKYNIKVEVTAKGSGAALQLAREGGADVVIVHARTAEDKFISDGYGINRADVMYNEFVIVGPPDDPAQINGGNDVVLALGEIFKQKAWFVSRCDNSGTHMRELELWKLAGIEPLGSWYIAAKKGMLETLEIASNQGAYVLTDQSTYLFNQKELDLVVIIEGDKLL